MPHCAVVMTEFSAVKFFFPLISKHQFLIVTPIFFALRVVYESTMNAAALNKRATAKLIN